VVYKWVRRSFTLFLGAADAVFNSTEAPVVEAGVVRETVRIGEVGGQVEVDPDAHGVIELQLADDVSIDFADISGDRDGTVFMLVLEQGGSGGASITWQPPIEWDGGSEPSLPDSGGDKHLLKFRTVDDGGSWIGSLGPTNLG